MKPLLQVLMFTLVSVTYASAEINITCSHNNQSVPFVIDEAKQEIRRVDKAVNLTTLVFHDDMIMFDRNEIGKPYKNPPSSTIAGSLFVTRVLLHRGTGEMHRQSIVAFQDIPTVRTFNEVWDCSLDGKKF